MNKEHTRYLLETYPKLYCQYVLDMDQTAMCWGFECGDGWFAIIDRLSAVLEPTGVQATQVKEKFGGLRFYTDYTNDLVKKAIEAAEHASFKTCEKCGKKGKLRNNNGWLYTACKEHTRQ